jgi:hypothetical protein
MTGLVLAAWLAGAAGRLRAVVEVALLVALADCLHRAYPGVRARDVLPAIVAVAAAAALVVNRYRLVGALRRPAFAVAAALLVLLLIVGVGDELRRRAALDSYAKYDPVYSWIDEHAPSNAHVGLAGLASLRGIGPPLPAFGPRLGNDVEYVGPFVRHTLHEYNRRGPYQAAMRAGRYDLVIVGLGFAKELPPERIPEVGWTSELGYRMVARSRRLALLANRNMLARP